LVHFSSTLVTGNKAGKYNRNVDNKVLFLLLLFIQSPREYSYLVRMQATSSSSKYILAYDADCGPCTRFAFVVDILDKHEKIEFISLTNADQKGLLLVLILALSLCKYCRRGERR